MFHFSAIGAKVKNLSKASLIMIGVGVCSITLAVASIGVGFGIQNSRAAENFINSANSQSLFRTNGNHNQTIATGLMNLAAEAKKLQTIRDLGSGVKFASARDIAEANTGERGQASPRIKLFDTVWHTKAPGEGDTGVPYEIPQSILSWQLASITYPTGSGDPIFTFFNCGGGSFTNYYSEQSWSNFLSLRFDDLFATFPSGLKTSAIVKPKNLPARWQENQPNIPSERQGYTSTDNSMSNILIEDSFWTVSEYEITNLFQLNSDERSQFTTDWHNNPGGSYTCLRSSISTLGHAVISQDWVGGKWVNTIKEEPNKYSVQHIATHINSAAFKSFARFTANFHPNNGGSVVPTTNISFGNKISAPNVSYDGHTFDGWFTDSAFTTPFNFASDTIKSDIHLYAKWSVVTSGDGGAGDGGTGDGGEGTDSGTGGNDGDDNEPQGPSVDKPIVPDYKPDQSQKGLSAGAIGGIIGGSLVAVGGATCGVIYYISRRRARAVSV